MLVERGVAARTDTESREAWTALHGYLASTHAALFLWSADTKSAWRAEVRGNTISPVDYWGAFGLWDLEPAP